jgi:hypothetical protein
MMVVGAGYIPSVHLNNSPCHNAARSCLSQQQQQRHWHDSEVIKWFVWFAENRLQHWRRWRRQSLSPKSPISPKIRVILAEERLLYGTPNAQFDIEIAKIAVIFATEGSPVGQM